MNGCLMSLSSKKREYGAMILGSSGAAFNNPGRNHAVWSIG
jgi:hypothetical protein